MGTGLSSEGFLKLPGEEGSSLAVRVLGGAAHPREGSEGCDGLLATGRQASPWFSKFCVLHLLSSNLRQVICMTR